MKLIAYRLHAAAPDSPALMGVLVGERVTPLTSLEAFYKNTVEWRHQAATASGPSLALSEVQLAVPVPPSAKIICAAINYVAHGAESKLPTPQFPNLFARWACTLAPSGTPVVVPATEPEGLDWEVELAAIVGSTLHEADAEQAAHGILGYTPFNDISGRASQIQSMTLSTGQWAIGKNLDNSGAVGSVITTSDAYDPRGKRLSTKVNGTSHARRHHGRHGVRCAHPDPVHQQDPHVATRRPDCHGHARRRGLRPQPAHLCPCRFGD